MLELGYRTIFIPAWPFSVSVWRTVFCGLLVPLFLVPVSAQQKQPEKAPSKANHEATQFPDGPGKQAFLRICGDCHSLDNVIGRGYTEAVWTQVVGSMIQNGATGTNEQFTAIVRYLGANFGPAPDKIDVNRATALNLRNWLHLTQQQAKAVVTYRTKNGDFKSLNDLKKVPGTASHFWDLRKDRLTF